MSFTPSAPTNILNMLVFVKHGLKERINLCVFFQSLADFVYMTTNFLLYSDRIYLKVPTFYYPVRSVPPRISEDDLRVFSIRIGLVGYLKTSFLFFLTYCYFPTQVV